MFSKLGTEIHISIDPGRFFSNVSLIVSIKPLYEYICIFSLESSNGLSTYLSHPPPPPSLFVYSLPIPSRASILKRHSNSILFHSLSFY